MITLVSFPFIPEQLIRPRRRHHPRVHRLHNCLVASLKKSALLLPHHLHHISFTSRPLQPDDSQQQQQISMIMMMVETRIRDHPMVMFGRNRRQDRSVHWDGEGRDGTDHRGGYEWYYDDGGESGLRPLSTSVSDFLLGSGFDRLLGQLS
ncbi:hypothetical protein Droror1_Dr00010789 [Drosera rotundifolia]